MSTCIATIGIDGSGKSTCFHQTTEALAKEFSVAGIGDDVWLGEGGGAIRRSPDVRWATTKGLLGELVKGRKQKTLYQITKFAEMLSRVNVQNAMVRRYRPRYVVTDGSPLINVAGWASFYYPGHFTRGTCIQAMRYLCQVEGIPLAQTAFYLKHLPEVFVTNRLRLARFTAPDIVFFLHLNPRTSIERILKRGKERQFHETESFLDRLQMAYATVCDIVSAEFGTEVHTVPADDLSLSEMGAVVAECLQNA